MSTATDGKNTRSNDASLPHAALARLGLERIVSPSPACFSGRRAG